MPDLPPDVLHQAFEAACEAYDENQPHSRGMLAAVDAVVGVLEGKCVHPEICAERISWWQQKHAESKHDLELLGKENFQLREALGMARKEYGGKNIADLNEYGRLRLAVNGFQAMNGVLELQNKRQHARIKELKDRELQLQEQAGEMAEEIEELSSEVAELPEWHCPSCNAVTRARMADAAPGGSHPRVRELSMQVRIGELTTALTDAIEALSWASDYIAVDWPPPYRVENFRAVLSTTPITTEEEDA